MTVTGRDLNSVATPRINLTVVVTRVHDDEVIKSPAISSLEVLIVHLNVLNVQHCLCLIKPVCNGII